MTDATWITIISLAVTFLFMMGTPVLLIIFYWVVGCSFVLNLTLDNTGAEMLNVFKDGFALMAMPLFILTGDLINKSGIAKRLSDFAYSCLGWIRGGLSMAALGACGLFAAISGSNSATTATIGSMLHPEMVKGGYDERFSAATAAAGGCVGIIIPPSIIFIVYGFLMNLPISELFIAGIIPGAMMVLAMMVAAFIVCTINGWGYLIRLHIMRTVKTGIGAWLGFFAIGLVLWGIYTGRFSPTEAAGVTVGFGLIAGMLSLYLTILSGTKVWQIVFDTEVLGISLKRVICIIISLFLVYVAGVGIYQNLPYFWVSGLLLFFAALLVFPVFQPSWQNFTARRFLGLQPIFWLIIVTLAGAVLRAYVTPEAPWSSGFAVIVAGFIMFPLFWREAPANELDVDQKTMGSMLLVEGFGFKDVPSTVVRSAQISGILAPLIAVSVVMQQILSLLGAQEVIGTFVTGMGGYYPVLLTSMLMVFVAGMILESLPVTIILAPILAPIAASVGVDPIHFSVIFLVGASIGFITPPYGLNLYVASGVTGVPYFRLLRYSTMYLVALLSVWFLVAMIPELALFLLPDR